MKKRPNTLAVRNRPLMAVALSALALLAGASAAAGAIRASSGDAPAGGAIAVLATLGNGPTDRIVLAGAIGDWGKAVSTDRNGKPDENGNYVKVTLQKGGFEIDSTALNKKTADPRPVVASESTCSVSASGTAPVTFFNGSGLYKGISGTATVTLTFTGVSSRYRSGAKKGQCRHTESAATMLGSVIGRGRVSFT